MSLIPNSEATTRKMEEHAVNLRKKDRNEIIQGRRKLQKTEVEGEISN